jgi:hypothetical protein
MEILNKILELKKKIFQTDKLVDDLLNKLEDRQNTISDNEKNILFLKDEIRINIKKLDKMINEYNANS